MPTFFIDSADRAAVTRLLRTGLFGGVTTNPSILHKAGLGSEDIPDYVKWATDAGAKQVFAQAWGETAAEITERGHGIRALGPNVVVKVPASRQGIEAARQLSTDGPVLVTAVHSASQVLPVIASGATYMAPFLSRMVAGGRAGIPDVLTMQKAIDATGASLQIVAGSLRTPEQILELAVGGIQNMTFSPEVWDLFFQDELTAASVEQFEQLAGTA